MAFNIDKSFNSFTQRAISKFGNKYYYDRSSFTKMKQSIDIYCPIHGKFEVIPSKFLTGKGCTHCTNKRVADQQRSSNTEFIIKSKLVHKDKYDYSKVVYKTAKLPVIIICPEHGEFEQTPVKHTSQGCGCSQCTHYGINYTLPAILYYIKYTDPITDVVLYKIGITNKTVNERFINTELQNMNILFELQFSTAKEAYFLEQQIIKRYKQYRYAGPKLIHRGSTEFFTKDILQHVVTMPNNASLSTITKKLSTL